MMHGVDEITFFYSLATLFQASFNPLFEPSYLQKQNRESVKITNEMVNFQGMNIICHAPNGFKMLAMAFKSVILDDGLIIQSETLNFELLFLLLPAVILKCRFETLENLMSDLFKAP